tara:strand:- start:146 stop:517 length:372 start_codon:yes stop_codon:yes gene_type:complete
MGLVLGDGRFSGFQNPSMEFLVKAWTWPIILHWLILIGIGVASSIGGYLISQAYRLSEAGLIAPFEYTSLILSVFWGIFIWNEWLNFLTLLGITLIIISGVYIAVREVKVGVKPSAKRSSGRR